jgi:alkaline phosphatase
VNAGDAGDFDPGAAVERAVQILSRNPNGFFLMVEWDMHTTNVKKGLDRVIAIDDVIRRTAEKMKDDTLVIYTADHSFDIRVRGGRQGEPMLPEAEADGAAAASPKIRVDNGHTGEQVLTAAEGPGAERVRGFIDNTDLFRIMMAAYGWDGAEVSAAAAGR